MIVRTFAVFCDRARAGLTYSDKGCYSWPGEHTNTGKEARALARRQGWRRVPDPNHPGAPKIDLCPNCATMLETK